MMTSVNSFFFAFLLAWYRICSVSGTVSFSKTPESTCVCGGSPVTFDCIALSEGVDLNGNTVTVITAQRWEITPLSGTAIMVDSAPMANNPEGYAIVLNSENRPVGLTVLNPDISLNQASLVCTGYDPSINPAPSASAPAVTLEVGGLSIFTCSVTCPEFYSSVNNFCNVTWTAPTAALCVSLTGFSLSVTNALPPKTFEASTLGSTTGDLEPFQSYTATVTAINSCSYNRHCSYSFTAPEEEAPENFSIDLSLVAHQHLTISTVFATSNPPMVTNYSVVIGEGHLQQKFSGDSFSLSLDISSLQQCMNYTVSVTATNTGGSRTASAILVLDFLTSLEVECSATETGCYLDITAVCVKDYPEVISGCTVYYMTEEIMNILTRNRTNTSNSIHTRIPVPCEMTFSYEGYAHNEMEMALCTESGMTACPPLKDCSPVNIPSNGMVTYSDPNAISTGTVATYSCEDEYELVGEKMRTCLVDGTWTGAEPACQVYTDHTCKDNVSPWFGVSIFLLIYFVLSMIVIVALTLKMFVDTRKRSGSHSVRGGSSRTTRETVELSENVCYGPVAPPQSGATQTVEYEEIEALTTTTTGKTPAEKK